MRAILRQLAVMGDVRAPAAGVEHDPLPLCWTTAPLRGEPTVHVTTGLLRTLPPNELEAVLAHELAHLVNRDATVMGLLAGPPTWALRGIKAMWWKREERAGNRMAAVMFGWFTAPPALLLAGCARIVSRHRELAADRTAALLTGSPAALAAALHRLAGELRGLPRTDLRVVAARDPLHLLPSRGDPTGLRRLWATHPPLADRLERLERLDRTAVTR